MNEEEKKERINFMKKRIKQITQERKELLSEQRHWRITIDELIKRRKK